MQSVDNVVFSVLDLNPGKAIAEIKKMLSSTLTACLHVHIKLSINITVTYHVGDQFVSGYNKMIACLLKS